MGTNLIHIQMLKALQISVLFHLQIYMRFTMFINFLYSLREPVTFMGGRLSYLT
jgi:hypothetical protein